MRSIRIFQPGTYRQGDAVELAENAARHVSTVLRMREGDSLILFSGNGEESDAIITHTNRKSVIVNIRSQYPAHRESPIHIHLAQAISKGDRMEWVVQKATELGVHAITPLLTERCNVSFDEQRSAKKTHQWQAIAVSACEQSGRNIIPLIHTPKTLDELLKIHLPATKLVMDPHGANQWTALTSPPKDALLLVGPEGGLSESEIAFMSRHDVLSMRLGPRILRTETAAVVGLTLMQARWGDLA